jgi:hypothetical protein
VSSIQSAIEKSLDYEVVLDPGRYQRTQTGLNKPTILLTQNIEDIPFAIRQLHHINYVNSPDGLEVLEAALLRLVFGEESNV